MVVGSREVMVVGSREVMVVDDRRWLVFSSPLQTSYSQVSSSASSSCTSLSVTCTGDLVILHVTLLVCSPPLNFITSSLPDTVPGT